jgi:hypothetical protein
MAEEGKPIGKTLTDVVDALDHLNAELDQQGADSRRSGAQVVKGGKIRGIFAFFHRRGQKKRLKETHQDITSLRNATMSEFGETETRHDDNQQQAGQQTTQLEATREIQEQLLEGDEFATGEMQRQTDHLEAIGDAAKDQVGNQLHHIDLVESGNEALTSLAKDAEGQEGFLDDIAHNAESLQTSFNEMLSSQNETTSLLGNMFDLQMKDSASFAEAAREAARGGDEGGSTADAKADEAKAGGFFSRMGKAVMNPIGAMGRGMKSAGKGIGGFLKGLSSGLASFANPAVLIGVTVMAVSLPIFAAGLAAAFKVFEMIAGEGSALKMITGVILALGEAIGTILHKVLTGFGNMIRNMGPFIKDFFTGIATVVKALTPILTSLFTVIKDIITDPVLNETIQTVLATVQVALQEIGKIVTNVSNIIIAALQSTEGILNSIFDGISKVIKTIGDAVIGIIDKIVEGVERLAVLPAGNMLAVAGALGVLSLALVGFSVGAAVAGGVMPSAEDLEKIAGSVKTFGDIEAGNLALVGDGMKKVGIGLLAFGAGGAIADLLMPTNSAGMEAVAKSVQRFGSIDGSNFAVVGDGIKKLGIGLAAFGGGGAVSALGDAFSSWIGGGKDPVDKFRAFAEIGPGLKDAGDGVSALAASFDAFNTDNLERIGNGLDKFLGATDMNKLKAFSQATEGLMTGQMLAQLQVESNKTGGGSTTIIQNTSTNQVNSSQPMVLPASGVSPSNSDIMNVRIVT